MRNRLFSQKKLWKKCVNPGVNVSRQMRVNLAFKILHQKVRKSLVRFPNQHYVVGGGTELGLLSRILESLIKVRCPSRFKSFLSNFSFRSYEHFKFIICLEKIIVTLSRPFLLSIQEISTTEVLLLPKVY